MSYGSTTKAGGGGSLTQSYELKPEDALKFRGSKGGLPLWEMTEAEEGFMPYAQSLLQVTQSRGQSVPT